MKFYFRFIFIAFICLAKSAPTVDKRNVSADATNISLASSLEKKNVGISNLQTVLSDSSVTTTKFMELKNSTSFVLQLTTNKSLITKIATDSSTTTTTTLAIASSSTTTRKVIIPPPAQTPAVPDENPSVEDGKKQSEGDEEDDDTPVKPPMNKKPEVNKNVDDGDITEIGDKVKNVAPSNVDEPENSHFMTYFLVFASLLAIGYVAFYKRKKIMGLLIEGRRSRSDRKNVRYRKLHEGSTDDDNLPKGNVIY